MESQELTRAIKHLRPNAEFKFENGDYATIEWIKLEGDAPIQAEIDAAIEQIKIEEAQAAAEAQAKRQALLAKLGITEEEAKLLLS